MIEANKIGHAKARFIYGLEGVHLLDNTGYTYMDNNEWGSFIIKGIEKVLLPYVALRYSNGFTFDTSPVWFLKSKVKEATRKMNGD